MSTSKCPSCHRIENTEEAHCELHFIAPHVLKALEIAIEYMDARTCQPDDLRVVVDELSAFLMHVDEDGKLYPSLWRRHSEFAQEYDRPESAVPQ